MRMRSKVDLQKISFENSYNNDGLTTAMYDGLNIEQVMKRRESGSKKRYHL